MFMTLFLRISILILLFIFFSSLACADEIKLSAGTRTTCILDDGGLKCWGYKSGYIGGDLRTPNISLFNPKGISVGSVSACAIDDIGIRCWGYGMSGKPSFNNPKNISVGSRFACAIDDEGVKCWGSNSDGQTTVPSLSNPKVISAGVNHACAIADEGVKCWGDDSFGKTTVPSLTNPKSISSGTHHTCAIDDDGVKCWGLDSYGKTKVPSLTNPKSISSGTHHTCAIDDDGIKCWGDDTNDRLDVPSLINPRVVSVGLSHTCAIDDEGVKCWGNNEYELTSVPDGLLINVDSDNDGILDVDDLFPYDANETIDTDNDSIGNNADADDDNDGVLDIDDFLPLNKWFAKDSDNDGMPDKWEETFNLDPQSPSDKDTDLDDDGLTALEEFNHQTDPNNTDSDKDTLLDGWEVKNGRDPSKSDYDISTIGGVNCAIDDIGTVCWGRAWSGDNRIGGLLNTTNVSVGGNGDVLCFLDDFGGSCYYRRFGFERLQFLNNPQEIGAGYVSCAIDDDGVKCWKNAKKETELIRPEGSSTDDPNVFTVPNLSNPSNLSVGRNHACVIDNNEVKCWLTWPNDSNQYGQHVVPELSNPKAVAAGMWSTCAIDDEGVKCWGLNNNRQAEPPQLSNPREISGGQHYCAIDDNGIFCWGRNTNGEINVPKSKHSTRVSAGTDGNGWGSSCSLGMDGIVCWGKSPSFDIKDNDFEDVELFIDPDGDGFSTQGGKDAFPFNASEWLDTDLDGIGNNTDTDDDNDDVLDDLDSFPFDSSEWSDTDGDLVGDNTDLFPNDASETTDIDADNIGDNSDNCLNIFNTEQLDTDFDGLGNACDDDDDNDGVIDSLDIFPLDNSEQTDTDDDGLGDNYEIVNGLDRKNPDFDSDGLKDGAEIELGTDPKLADSDDDGVIDGKDKFPLISIGDLLDTDFDGAPDACDEACIELGMLADNDDDNDGIDDRTDVHPLIAIVDLVDTDSDGAPDTCDSVCVELGMVADTDDDNDGVLDTADAYPLISIGDLTDTDSDGAPDTCDEACVEHGMQEDKGYGIDYGRGTPIYIRGSMNAWGMNDYLLNQGNELFTTSISLNEGSYEFYIASEDWSSLFLGPDDDSDKARNVIVGDSYTLSNQLTSSTPPFKMEVAEDTHYLFIFNNLEGNPSLTTFAVSDQGAIHPNVQNDIANIIDKDNDGVLNQFDFFPLISIGELVDTDSDGAPDTCDEACIELGMAADVDDDNDGVLDTADAYPLAAIGGLVDTDLDGAPDTCDEACVELGMAADNDDDNDGIVDTSDAYPLISIGDLVDTDSDGAPDTCDEACVELGMTADTDIDGDGVTNNLDAFPNDSSEFIDTDLDGIGNRKDYDDDNDQINDNVIYLAFNTTNNISGEFSNNSDVTDILTTPDLIKGWLKINKALIPRSTTDTTYINPVIAYGIQIGSYQIGPFENNSENYNEIRVIYDGKALDLYIWPNYTNELNEEQVEKISFRIDLPSDFNYEPGQSLVDVGELFERTNKINNSNSLSIWWPSGRTGNLDVDYFYDKARSTRLSDTYPLISIGDLVDTDSDGAPDTCNEACGELGMVADSDDDNDGVADISDAYPLISIGDLVDTDSDGAPDDCDEACLALNMAADEDDDNDGLTDIQEKDLGTSPMKPDTDGDSLSDLFEYESSSRDPLIADYHLEIGWQTACFTDRNGIKCWGKNDFNLLEPPIIKNSSALSMSSIQACTVYSNNGSLKCWGANQAPLTTEENIQDIAIGQYHSCTLINSKVNCLSSVGNQFGILDVPSEFSASVMSIESGNLHACAVLSDGTVKCWGADNENVSQVRQQASQSTNAIYDSFDSGPYINCGTKGNTLECFGENAESLESLNIGKEHIYDIAILDAAVCTVSNVGIKCGGNVNGTPIPSPTNTTSSSAVVAIGKTFACALDDMNIKCWGYDPNNLGVLNPPVVYLGDFDGDTILDNIDTDDDNDGVLDTADAYPLIAIGDLVDTDSDGAPDTCAESCLELGMLADTDDDNDGVLDVTEIELGTDPKLSDTDGDGVNDNEDDSTVIISSIFPSLNVTVIGPFNDISRGSFRLTSSANPNMLVIYPISITGNKMEFEYKFPSNAVSSEYKISTVAMVRENDEVVQEYNNYYFDLINENEEVSEFSIQDPHVSYDGKLGLVNVRFIVDGLIDGITRVWPIGTRESLNMDLGFIDGSAQRLKGRVLNREVLDGINGTNVLNFNYFIADELLPETIYVRSIALTDKALNGVYHTVDTDEDRIIDALDVYPLIPLGEYIDTNKNGAPEQCDESCAALGMSTEDIFNPKYYRLEQSTFEFASLTPTAKVIVTGSQGNNFFDIARYVNDVSLVGQTFLVSGSGNVDGFMVMPGVKYDLTNLKGSVDGIYFSGPFAEYADSILLDPSSGVMQLSRLTDIGEEIVQFIATASAADVLVFTDGAISTSAIKDAIINETPMGDLVLDTSVSALDTKPTTGATVKHIVLDNNGAGVMALGPNISTLISGSSGMDHIYVPAGSVVDASNLKSGQDEIYLEGALTDYSLTLDNSGNITLTRDITVNDENVTEQVTVASGGNVATNDLVIFADQQLQTQALKEQYLN